MLCQVNLIPLNPTEGYAGRPSSRARVAAFQEELSRFGVHSTVRVRRGIDIQAGCGQLRDRALM
jgi:23S rRNA (adenine2503-C2)-methyltransferase